jgi:hypothetical protein
MCKYNLAVDDVLVEEIRPHIGKDVAMQSWLEDVLHQALVSYAEKLEIQSKNHSETIYKQVKELGDTPEGFFGLGRILKPSRFSAEELKDEYIREKYGV